VAAWYLYNAAEQEDLHRRQTGRSPGGNNTEPEEFQVFSVTVSRRCIMLGGWHGPAAPRAVQTPHPVSVNTNNFSSTAGIQLTFRHGSPDPCRCLRILSGLQSVPERAATVRNVGRSALAGAYRTPTRGAMYLGPLLVGRSGGWHSSQ
jgi:hypothetical protein